jgi:uncharacterized protein YoxC
MNPKDELLFKKIDSLKDTLDQTNRTLKVLQSQVMDLLEQNKRYEKRLKFLEGKR